MLSFVLLLLLLPLTIADIADGEAGADTLGTNIVDCDDVDMSAFVGGDEDAALCGSCFGFVNRGD